MVTHSYDTRSKSTNNNNNYSKSEGQETFAVLDALFEEKIDKVIYLNGKMVVF